MSMTPIERLVPPEDQDEKSIYSFAQCAKEFLLSCDWCLDIRHGSLAQGWDGILGVFQFNIVPQDAGVARQVWVVAGDVPPAYLVDEEFGHPADVLEGYVHEMRRWVEAVQSGQPAHDLIPVYYGNGTDLAPPTKEFARDLARRLRFIESDLIPESRETWKP